MFVCCLVGLGIGSLAVWGYTKIKENKNTKINKPLSGSFAKVWTEINIPDLTKKVPVTLKIKVNKQRIITQK